jgi:DnaJ-class molecular chaperone
MVLEVDMNATQEEIKIAFKKQALKWHPDRNLGLDTTIRMQKINEAYLILKDNEAKTRYNNEYIRYQQHRKEKSNQQEFSYEDTDYKVEDDILNKWMNNAKRQAVNLAKQTIKDFKGMVSVGAKAAGKEAGNMLIAQIAIGLIFTLIIALSKSCNN